jgi:DNA-binding beta-propeller fold protein YncE
MHTSRAVSLTLLLAAASGCSEYDYGQKSDTGYAMAGSTAQADAGPERPDESDEYEPEQEGAYDRLPPATTDAFVFVANPDRNTVTRVSVSDLSVITAEVGVDPLVVETTSDYATAVVFNRGTDDVSIVDSETLSVATVPVRPDFNQMVMSPDGRWVACFHDAAQREDEDLSEDTWSFNEVSLVDVENRIHVPMVVGFNPREIRYSADSARMVVVSDAYLAVIDLTADTPEPVRIPIAEDALDPPVAEEVVLTPDGTHAIIRQFGASSLVVANLPDGSVDLIDVGDNPTDLDVTPDGQKAIAVARGSNELWLYDMNDIFAPAEVLSMPAGEVLGSIVLSPDNSKGLLYSTASGVSRFSSWNRLTDEIDVHPAVKPITGIDMSPGGGVALLAHDADNGDTDPDSVFYNEYAVTLVELEDFFANPIRMPAEPTEFAATADGNLGFVIMEDDASLIQLDYRTLIHDEVELKSSAVHMGVLPETRTVYVSQEHDLGRISFYDADSAALQTITGFELNSAIEVEQ